MTDQPGKQSEVEMPLPIATGFAPSTDLVSGLKVDIAMHERPATGSGHTTDVATKSDSTPVFPRLREATLKQRRLEKLVQRRDGIFGTACFLALGGTGGTLVATMPVSSVLWPIGAFLSLMAMVTVLGPAMLVLSYRKVDMNMDGIFNPDELPFAAATLASDLTRLSDLLMEKGDERAAEFGTLSASVARRFRDALNIDFSKAENVDHEQHVSPERAIRSLQRHIALVVSDFEGTGNVPPTISGVQWHVVWMITSWRRCASDMGLMVTEILHAEDMPIGPARQALRRHGDDMLDLVESRLQNTDLIRRLRDLRRRFQETDQSCIDDLDRIETTNMIDRHLPDLATRFVTAYDASSGQDRATVMSVATSSLEMIASAIEATLARKAASARHALEDGRRFLETKTTDAWSLMLDDTTSDRSLERAS